MLNCEAGAGPERRRPLGWVVCGLLVLAGVGFSSSMKVPAILVTAPNQILKWPASAESFCQIQIAKLLMLQFSTLSNSLVYGQVSLDITQ